MLAAIVLAGLAAAVVPMMLGGDSGDEEIDLLDDEPQGADPDAGGSSLLDGAIYEIPAGSGQTILSQFDPSSDRVTLNVDSWDCEFVIEAHEDGGIALSVIGEADGPTLIFPGLQELPVEAIEVALQQEGDDLPVFLPLSEVFAAAEAEDADTGPGDALIPTDGDTEEDSFDGSPDEDEDAPLAPIDPDAEDDPGSGDPVGDVLAPIDPDAPDTPPANAVTGAAMHAVSIDQPDANDATTEGGDGLAYPDQPASVSALATGETLLIELTGAQGDALPEIGIETDADGNTVVLVGGTPVAVLPGPDAVSIDQIILRASIAA